MDAEFILDRCVNCDRCIWATPMGIMVFQVCPPLYPTSCGNIDEEGGFSIELDRLTECPKGLKLTKDVIHGKERNDS